MAVRFRSFPIDAQRDGLSVSDSRAHGETNLGVNAVKRLMDLVIAVAALILLSPLLLVIAIAIATTTRGSIIFQQVRIGRNGREFVVLKFRTMYEHADDAIHRQYVIRMLTEDQPPNGGESGVYKLVDDPRVTPVGAWLRRASLDELPQLFNVLRGEMSLVGPRPILPWEAELCPEGHRERFLVKPGMTGLWQITHRNSVSMQEAFDLDVQYVQRQSILLDLTILLKTLPVVLSLRGL